MLSVPKWFQTRFEPHTRTGGSISSLFMSPSALPVATHGFVS